MNAETFAKRLGDYKWEKGDNYAYNCPFCEDIVGSSDRSRHLKLHFGKGKYHCFRCDARGSMAHLAKLLKLDWKERRITPPNKSLVDGIKEMKLRANDHGENESFAVSKDYQINLPDGLSPLCAVLGLSFGRDAQKLLSRKHISVSLATQWGLQVGVSGKFVDFIVFPTTYQGRLVYYSSRHIYNGTKLHPSKEDAVLGKSMWLYGYDQAPKENGELYLCEGPFDALAISAAVGGGLAMFGSSISDAQVHRLLEKKPRCVTIVLDADAANKAYGIAEKLMVYTEVMVAYMPAGDPDEYEPEKLRGILAGRQAVNHTSRLEGLLKKQKK